MHHILNPNLMDVPSSVCNRIPFQNGEPYDVYVSVMRFFNCMNGFIHNRSTDYGDRHTQDVFLSNMDHADAIMKYILLIEVQRFRIYLFDTRKVHLSIQFA
jgi:hypothetical protein